MLLDSLEETFPKINDGNEDKYIKYLEQIVEISLEFSENYDVYTVIDYIFKKLKNNINKISLLAIKKFQKPLFLTSSIVVLSFLPVFIAKGALSEYASNLFVVILIIAKSDIMSITTILTFKVYNSFSKIAIIF